MTEAEQRRIRNAANMLTALLEAARSLQSKADHLRMIATSRALAGIADTLDGARCQLLEDGASYLDAASAFVRVAAEHLAVHAAVIGRSNHR